MRFASRPDRPGKSKARRFSHSNAVTSLCVDEQLRADMLDHCNNVLDPSEAYASRRIDGHRQNRQKELFYAKLRVLVRARALQTSQRRQSSSCHRGSKAKDENCSSASTLATRLAESCGAKIGPSICYAGRLIDSPGARNPNRAQVPADRVIHRPRYSISRSPV